MEDKMKKVLIALTAAVALVALIPSTASAQATGDVDVDITVNGIVILYYYDNISVNIPSAAMAQLMGASATSSIADTTWGGGFAVDAAYGAGALTVDDGAPTNSALTLPNAVPFTIQNAWAVRGLLAAGSTVTVSVTNPVALLGGGAAGDIGVSATACSGTCTGLTPTLATPAVGDVGMTLDFTTVNTPGNFAAAPAFTIEANIV